MLQPMCIMGASVYMNVVVALVWSRSREVSGGVGADGVGVRASTFLLRVADIFPRAKGNEEENEAKRRKARKKGGNSPQPQLPQPL